MSDPYDVTTIGETMLRISTPPGHALETSTHADLRPAGAESNVASALAGLGRRVAWCGRLPDNPPGRLIASVLRRSNVDLSLVEWCNTGRVGSFYVELETPPTPVRVTYDRADSCAVAMSPDRIDWARLLNTRLLHLTGITPALSAACRETTIDAVQRAKHAKVPISFDINYRSKLWTPEQAAQTLLPLIQQIDLLLIGRSDARDVFDLSGAPEQILTALADRTGAKTIVLTVGAEGVVALSDGTIHREPAKPTTILDRLGAGDALAAGVIHGWLDHDLPKALRYGTALAAKALRTHGDVVTCGPAELDSLIQTASDRPQR